MTRRKAIFALISLAVVLALAGTALALDVGAASPSAGVSVDRGSDPSSGASTTSTQSTTTSDRQSVGVTGKSVDTSDADTSVETIEAPGAGGHRPDSETKPSTGPVHQTLPGAGGPPPVGPVDPIGDLDDDRPIPAGLDLQAPAQPQASTNGISASDDLAAAPSCAHQCITRGVAYPRGLGAELVVETSVPAALFVTAIADTDDDGEYEESHLETTPFGETSHSWALDHLEPDETYHVMAAATDAHGHTSHVWGEFTTLSRRDVFVELGPAEVTGPGGVTSTSWWLGLDGPLMNVTPGQQGILWFQGRARHLDLEFWMTRFHGDGDEICEAIHIGEGFPSHGYHGPSCTAWNSALATGIDLDVAPGGKTRWTETSIELSLHPDTGEGDALPPGYGQPHHFHFEMPITLHVTYS